MQTLRSNEQMASAMKGATRVCPLLKVTLMIGNGSDESIIKSPTGESYTMVKLKVDPKDHE
jgi:hypothetical protein